uniref:Peroxidase n=1 Tax=Timema tahoe TaxID=61484 RepID=A0A7R9IG06_9NEOP|nr:unnamed protein product [Timema tahoe]
MTGRSRFESQSDNVPAQSHSSPGVFHGPASYSSSSRGPGSFFSEFSGDLTNFFTAAGPSKQAFQSAGADFSQTQSADTHGLSGLRMSFSNDSINKLDNQSSPKLLLNLLFTIFKRHIVLSAEQLVTGNGTACFSPKFGDSSLSGFQQGCGPQVSGCQKSKYRSLDGTCNNPYKPTWGAANTPYARVKPAKYADGVQDPPVSHSGKPLPGARLVSAVLFPDADVPDPKWTLIAMQWGQIITHDLSQAAGTTQAKAHSTNCCSEDKSEAIPKEYRDPTCFPIEVLHDDPHYAQHSQQCMNFVRTTTDLSQGCSQPFKPAEQIVAVTHFMDCSIIYGSSKQQTDSLREWKGGRLRMEYRHGKGFPPSSTNKSSVCVRLVTSQLTILHVVLIREHNRVAGHLNKLNPHWDDNKLFHEARRIVIAEHQHISYYEWLPIFLGWESTKHHGLTYDTHDYTHDYSEHVDPSVINGHATAAFRYFHTNIAGYLQ